MRASSVWRAVGGRPRRTQINERTRHDDHVRCRLRYQFERPSQETGSRSAAWPGTVIEANSLPNYARVSVADSVPRSPYAKVSGVSVGTSTAPQYEAVVTIMPARSGVPPTAR